MRKPITFLICDASEIVRKGIEITITSSGLGTVLGSCARAEQALAEVCIVKPEMVVTDANVPGLELTQFIRSLKEQPDAPRVVVLANSSDESTVLSTMVAGADAYCLKHAKQSHLADAILAAASGACWLHPDVGASIFRRTAPRPAATPITDRNFARLSAREMQVLQLVANGLSNREIAAELFLSAETVKTHIRHIMEKMQVADRTQAAIKAVREGLLQTA